MIRRFTLRRLVWVATGLLTLAMACLSSVALAGDESMDELLDQLQHTRKSSVRIRAAEALAQYGEDAVPMLRKLLLSGHELVRPYAGFALIQMGPCAEPAVPDLIRIVEDHAESEDLREIAVVALGRIGPAACGALPALQAALYGTSPTLRRKAISALISIAAPESVTALSELLERGGPEEQQAVLDAVWAKGAGAKPFVPIVLAFGAQHPDGEWSDRAFMTAAAVGGDTAADVVPYLRADRLETRRRGALALSRLGPEAIAAVPALSEALQDQAGLVRFWAAKALGNTGPAARPAMVCLLAALKDIDPHVRWAAISAIAKIDPAALTAADWSRLLADSDPGVRQRAAAIRSARL